MLVRSLGYRTDLALAALGGGEVIDRGDLTVVRTRSNPGFRWGNFLLFEDPPGPGDLERWTARFAAEIGPPSAVSHLAFAWDRPDGAAGELEPFREAGLEVMESVVLTCGEAVRPPRLNPEAGVRQLDGDVDWAALLVLKLACREDEDPDGYESFARRRVAAERGMVESGRGRWYGAFQDGRLAAALGLFRVGELARYQSVETHPAYRRRGLCSTLVHHAALEGLGSLRASRLVIVADANYHALGIYESCGFRPTERLVSLQRR